jgi:2,3-bisphosphoglycerate-independent phosphoglycerate mutase
VAGRSALTWVRPLEQHLKSLPVDGAIASGGGRMGITMDRYGADWDMVERGWAVHVHGSGRRFASASKAIETMYAEDPQIDDQYLPAFVVGEFRGIMDGDAVVLCNFRGDRAMELSRAFDDDVFSYFDRGRRPKVFFAGLMEYDGDLGVPKHFLVEPPAIDNTVAHHLEQAGKRSLAISETQKFGHVTYFFNGNRGTRPASEEWLEVPSLNTPFDKTPQMAAREITKAVVQALSEGGRDHIRLNLANGDMVGHTGKMAATIAAMEVIDECLGALATATAAANGVLIITADHGNADQMFAVDKKTGQYRLDTHNQRVIRPSHTLNPVPFVLLDSTGRWSLSARSGPHIGGGLASVGSTHLQLCGLKPPAEYAPSLVQHIPR